jgi:hypothetical protein
MYNVNDHGDLLEKEATEFIRTKFPYYESVWQTYIGNVGNATIAPLPNYPNTAKRISFSEHSYTVLESCYMIQLILDTHIFEAEIKNFKTYFDFNKSLICFFACLGRIRDTVIKAAEDLGMNTNNLQSSLKEYYEARNIIIHGKRIPIVLDEHGMVMMPLLKTEKTRGDAWSDKGYGWADISYLPTEYANTNCSQYFDGLLEIINGVFALFLNVIQYELKSIRTSLQFIRNAPASSTGYSGYFDPSGSTRVPPGVVDVYKIKEGFPKK